MDAAEVKLLFWPAKRPSDALCGNATASPLTAAPTIEGRPNTIVTRNTTLTSPTVYIQILGHWAYNTNGIATTATSDSFLPQSSESVFSYCASTGGDFGEARPVNYADFQHPVPASEYRCQPHCWTRKYAPSYIDYTWSAGGRTGIGKTWTFDDVNAIATENQCSTIWDDFEPVLSIPPEFFSQQGREVWGSITCDFVIHGGNVFWDPPVALTPQSTVAGVSRPAGAQSAEATPTSGVTSQSAETGNMPGPTTPTPARGSEVTAEGALSQTNGPSESDTPVASPDIATVKESRSSSGVPGSATSRKKEGEPKVAGPPTPTTSRSIGDIIASVIGEVRPTTERPEQSDEGIAVSSEVEPAETGGGSSLGSGGGNDQDDGNGGDDGDSNGGNDNGSNGASTGGGESGSNSDNGSDHGSQGQQKEGSGEAGPVNDSGNNDRDDGYQEQDQGSEPAPTDTAGKVASILGAQVPHNAQDPQSTAHALGDGAGSTQGSQNDGSQPAPVASQGTDAGSGEDTQPAAAGVVLTGADGTVHTLIPSSVVVDPINREAPLTPAADQTIVISGVGTVVLQSSGTAVADSTQAYSAIELETLETLAAGSIVTNSDSEQYTITYDTAASGAVMTTIISGVGTVFIQPSGVVVDGSTQAYSPLKDEASTTLTPGQVVTAADGTPYTISHDAVASGDNLTTTASGLGPVVIQASATSASEAISDSADTKTTSPLGSGQGSIGGVSASGGAQLDSAGVSLLSRLLSTLGMLAATGLVAAWAM